MKREDKELLLRDLCCRLGNVIVVDVDEKGQHISRHYTLRSIDLDDFKDDDHPVPYLRPMSSMTDEEKVEYKRLCVNAAICNDYQQVDYLNSNYFDYRGLIPMGLALKAPEGMYNIK